MGAKIGPQFSVRWVKLPKSSTWDFIMLMFLSPFRLLTQISVESEDLKCLVVGCSKVQAGGGLLC